MWSQQALEPTEENPAPWGQACTAVHRMWLQPVFTTSQPESQSQPLLCYQQPNQLLEHPSQGDCAIGPTVYQLYKVTLPRLGDVGNLPNT